MTVDARGQAPEQKGVVTCAHGARPDPHFPGQWPDLLPEGLAWRDVSSRGVTMVDVEAECDGCGATLKGEMIIDRGLATFGAVMRRCRK